MFGSLIANANATDEQWDLVVTSHDPADAEQLKLLKDNLCFKLKMAWECYSKGDKSKAIMDILDGHPTPTTNI